MDMKEIERLLTLMKEHDLVEVELEDPADGTRLKLKKAVPQAPVNSQPVLTAGVAMPHPVLEPVRPPEAPAPAPAAGAPAEAPVGEEEQERANLVEIPSPMVGTFYRAPSPEADSFVEVGDQIDDESVVCIIEAMKVMNEIKAEVAGEVVEILVHNGEAVEYDQPLFLIRAE